MILLNEYMKTSKIDRQKHLDLSESCHHRGTNSRECRGLLAYFLNTDVPMNRIAHCCHACNNGECSNPRHLYWGTPGENNEDSKAEATEKWKKAHIAGIRKRDAKRKIAGEDKRACLLNSAV